jgi:hypothetical protein
VVGLATLVAITFTQQPPSAAAFVVSISIMIISVAAAATLSCFEPILGFVNPETQTLVSHETV